MADTIKKVGLIGAGAMGQPMAENLLKKGFETYVIAHRNRQPVEELVGQGAVEVNSYAEMAGKVDAIVTMVPDAPQVEEVCFGPDGIVEGAKPGLLLIDMSTISPTSSKEIAQRLGEKGISMLDAPVSGGPFRAKSGTLAIMVGGDKEVYERGKSVLEALGSPTLVGPNGLGETVKMVNQIIIGVLMLGLSEGFTFGVKAGANAEALREVLMNATSANYLMDKWLPQNLFKDDYSQGFASELLYKDLNAALSAGRDLGVPMMATAFAKEMYGMIKGLGYNREDYSAVSRLYQDAAGITIATGEKREPKK
jgi:3-hydroxyisobutyrate dehydrogenase-like beta-hydroxyacid dehydrogenase